MLAYCFEHQGTSTPSSYPVPRREVNQNEEEGRRLGYEYELGEYSPVIESLFVLTRNRPESTLENQLPRASN